ncbi:MAG: hypothetical protein HC874_23625 [Richelia sp. SL_2_1]|nr:hypothetical protein [Richelia sp. SL_2_1]
MTTIIKSVANVVENYNTDEDDEFGDCAVTPQMLREKAGIEETETEDDEFGDCAVTPQMLREKANITDTVIENDFRIDDNSPKLFAPLPVNNQWHIDRDEMFSINRIREGENIHSPFVVDTEYDSFLREIEQRKRTKLVLQVKGIDKDSKSIIFVNESLKTVINSHRIGQKTRPFYPLKTDFLLLIISIDVVLTLALNQ